MHLIYNTIFKNKRLFFNYFFCYSKNIGAFLFLSFSNNFFTVLWTVLGQSNVIKYNKL